MKTSRQWEWLCRSEKKCYPRAAGDPRSDATFLIALHGLLSAERSRMRTRIHFHTGTLNSLSSSCWPEGRTHVHNCYKKRERVLAVEVTINCPPQAGSADQQLMVNSLLRVRLSFCNSWLVSSWDNASGIQSTVPRTHESEAFTEAIPENVSWLFVFILLGQLNKRKSPTERRRQEPIRTFS